MCSEKRDLEKGCYLVCCIPRTVEDADAEVLKIRDIQVQ